MQGIYTYIPETNHVPREYDVAAILSLLFMVPISPVIIIIIIIIVMVWAIADVNIKRCLRNAECGNSSDTKKFRETYSPNV
jgi:hypothetical protein